MKKNTKKITIMITSLVLLLLVAVGTTLAYIFTKTEPVENTFKPSKVSCAVVENGSATENAGNIVTISTNKTDVRIKNTGDTDAYIRVAVVVNWASEDGTKVWATKPVLNTDYTITYATGTGWEPGADGYYYYTKSVAPGTLTKILISQADKLQTAPPEGYYLSIEIVASAIQSKPDHVVGQQWSSEAVTVTGNNGTLTVDDKQGG